MSAVIRFGTKLCLVGGAVYYTNELGVWEDGDRATEVIKTVRTLYHQNLGPYVKDMKTNIPVDVPSIPPISCMTSMAKSSWNSGVLYTFKFIGDLPHNIKQLSSNASNFISQQLEAGSEPSK